LIGSFKACSVHYKRPLLGQGLLRYAFGSLWIVCIEEQIERGIDWLGQGPYYNWSNISFWTSHVYVYLYEFCCDLADPYRFTSLESTYVLANFGPFERQLLKIRRCSLCNLHLLAYRPSIQDFVLEQALLL
jgi:hypothetical protein